MRVACILSRVFPRSNYPKRHNILFIYPVHPQYSTWGSQQATQTKTSYSSTDNTLHVGYYFDLNTAIATIFVNIIIDFMHPPDNSGEMCAKLCGILTPLALAPELLVVPQVIPPGPGAPKGVSVHDGQVGAGRDGLTRAYRDLQEQQNI